MGLIQIEKIWNQLRNANSIGEGKLGKSIDWIIPKGKGGNVMSREIKFLTVCGSGIVTSSMIANIIEEMLGQEGYEAYADEANPTEMPTYLARAKYDFVAYASPIDDDDLNGIPAIPAIGLITGQGVDHFKQKMMDIIKTNE